ARGERLHRCERTGKTNHSMAPKKDQIKLVKPLANSFDQSLAKRVSRKDMLVHLGRVWAASVADGVEFLQMHVGEPVFGSQVLEDLAHNSFIGAVRKFVGVRPGALI